MGLPYSIFVKCSSSFSFAPEFAGETWPVTLTGSFLCASGLRFRVANICDALFCMVMVLKRVSNCEGYSADRYRVTLLAADLRARWLRCDALIRSIENRRLTYVSSCPPSNFRFLSLTRRNWREFC